jgi:hypothetical protein
MIKTNALKRLTMLGAMMAAMMAALPAMGQNFYVIKAGNNFLAHTNATTIGNATTFNATTCLWTINGSNIIAISPDGTTGNTLGYTTSTSRWGYVTGCTLSLAPSPANTDWDDATSEPSYYAQTSWNGYTTFYLRYNNGWGMANENTHATVTSVTFSDAPNTSGSSSTSYSASVNGDDMIYSTSGTHTYTADVNQVITYAQTIRTFSGYANSGTTAATIDKPYPVSSAYTGTLTNVNWSVSPTTYCTINASTGVLTITSLPASVASVTITYSAQAGGQTIAAIKTVMLAKDAATAEGVAGVPTGTSTTTVTLNDYEDHSWAYYSDPNCPIRSLNPANVKITYYGNGVMMTGTTDYTASRTDTIHPGNSNYVGSAKVNVTAGETQNTFVYYKTLERTDGSTSANPTGRCPYTTIPNPFQVRPTYGGTATSNTAAWDGWRGFQCWRLKSVSGGSVYSAASGGTALTAGAVINGETQIYFAPTSEYGMAVDLEAVWAIAYVVKASDGGANAIGDHSNVGYERNFIVLNTTSASYNFGGTSGKRITNIDRQVTVTRYLPNGVRGQNNDATYVRGAANNYNLTLQANTKFENVAFNMGENTLTAAGYNLIIGRGCTGSVNYVRGLSAAVNPFNYKIRIESATYQYISFTSGYENTSGTAQSTSLTCTGTSNYVEGVLGCDYDRATGDNSKLENTGTMIMGVAVTLSNQDVTKKTFDLTVKSGRFFTFMGDNMMAGDASQSLYMSIANVQNLKAGERRLTIQGGELTNVAGGIDAGNQTTNNGVKGLTIRMTGGNVKGAIYGGAAVSPASGDRELVITGGTVKGWIGAGCNGVTGGNATIGGQTYGKSSVYIGGTVQVGGSNSINGSAGGTVFAAGKGSGAANELESGMMAYGTTIAIADDCDILNNVYGGGNFGFAQTSTNMYITGGHVHGDIFGGSNQNNGPDIDITMRAGKIDGGLYGGSNTSGNITGHINIDVYGTDAQDGANYAVGAVYGGGNHANYSGAPNVSVHCGENISIEYVYGGGNAATVTGTNVTIEGGNKIGNVFGGCYGANVTTSGTKVNVKGGTIGKVFGGNNQSGSITGAIKVRVNKDGTCPLKIGELYGGGNVAASAVGSIDIGCTGALTAAHSSTPEQIGYTLEGIGDVYGGANEANITSGNVNLTIDSGMVYRVFGGNNTSGTISGTITVNIDKQDDACGWYVGYVYGGGNKAPYGRANQNFPVVNVSNGLVSYNVYGGGKGNTAIVTGNPQVPLDGTAEVGGNVYGGGDAAAVTGSTKVTLRD